MRRLTALFVVALFAGAAFPALAQSSYPYTPAPYQSPYQQQYQQPYQAQPYDQQLGQAPYEERRRRGGIRILSAWYGVEGRACNAERPIARACDGQQSCTVQASNRLCGDPVPNVVKVLTVDYRCRGRERSITRWEGRALGLRCD